MSRKIQEYRVQVVEQGRDAEAGWEKCEIGENLKVVTGGLEALCLANTDARVLDAFVVASAVQFSDHTKARPSSSWHRDITVNVPVFELAHWKSSAVSDALQKVMTVLTGDRRQFVFRSRTSWDSSKKQLVLEMPQSVQAVLPFSGGLDSVAVARLENLNCQQRLQPVQLGNRCSNAQLQEPKWKPSWKIPYKVDYGRKKSIEASARSRGFSFAMLSSIAALFCDSKKIIMTESGQSALGPVLVPVGQTYEDYRSHPRFTKYMEAFISVLFDHEVEFCFPRLWHTKGETLNEFLSSGGKYTDLLDTNSCWRDARHTSVKGNKRQCGICAACLLRRMSMLACRCREPNEKYVWSDLSAALFEEGIDTDATIRNIGGTNLEYAVAGTQGLNNLAKLRHSQKKHAEIRSHSYHLSRELGIPKDETHIKLDRLLKQHEEEWGEFIESLGPKSFVTQWILGGR